MKTTATILRLAAASTLFVAVQASSQVLGPVTVEPASIKAGESVKLTAQFEVTAGTNCGVRVHWGDGSTGDFKINQTKDVPLVTAHTYAAAGTYKVMVEPKTQGTSLKCGGRNQTVELVVASKSGAAPAPAGKAAASTPAANKCPAGWTLTKAGVAKSGAFTCTAKPGTELPQARIACPGDLGYFENAKKGQLGCRP